MKAKPNPNGDKLRSDSYEASLTDEQREALYLLLSDPKLSLKQVSLAAAAWRGGEWDGEQPSIGTIGNIATRIRTEEQLLEVEATAKMLEAVHAKLAGRSDEATLDAAMELIGQEVIQKTLMKDDPKNRTAAARLMLKRADQRRFDRRMKFLEDQADKTKKVLADERLTPEEKQAKIKQVFGMS